MFTDEQFIESCNELDVPNVTGWDFFIETNNTKIYRQCNEETGLYSYKIYGKIPGVTADTCARVYTDIDYRKQWDGYVKDLYEIKVGDRAGLYWQVKFPFPLSNRDYTYVRSVKELKINGRNVWVILAKAETFDSVPPLKGVVRVSEYDQSMAITEDASGGTNAFMRYYDNPGGMIPTWLINWAAQKGVPTFLDGMHKACRGYPEYLAAKTK